MVDDLRFGTEDKRGNWTPSKPISYGPAFAWPPQPQTFVKWFFGFPGYLLPWNVLYAALALFIWFYLTPPLENFATLTLCWFAVVLARNLVLAVLVYGGWHLWFYVLRKQGMAFKYSRQWPKEQAAGFRFGNQTYDNMFHTLVSGVPIWTAYEVVTWWLYANHVIPYVNWGEHPVYCVVMMCLIPIMREVHFYLIHRLIHWGPLYKWVHYLHHNNVDVGPITGLSMHPVEHLFYWSGVIIHWIIPSHPIHALFHMQQASFSPAQGHAGFETVVLHDGVKVKTGDYFHYLHHKYFECNYGGDGPVNVDRWFGTFHDGTQAATDAMNERFLARAAQKAAGEGGS